MRTTKCPTSPHVHRIVPILMCTLVLTPSRGQTAAADPNERQAAEVSSAQQPTRVQLSIPAQSLAEALTAFSLQTNVQIVYEGYIAQNRRSPGVTGDLSVEEALQRLLMGTGLQFRFTDENTVTLTIATAKRTTASAASQPSVSGTSSSRTTALPEMTVTASNPLSNSYSVPTAITATKMNTPVMETPVSIQVIPRAIMDDQQVVSVADALKNVSGVQPAGYTFYDNFILRGFDANFSIYRNGLRHQSTTSIETANLDSIEVLKGPAAILYGRSEPGGLVNLTTKRPLPDRYLSVQQQFGSFDLYRTMIDTTGPLLEDRSLLYRVNLAYRNNNTVQDFVSQENFFFAPSLSWHPDARFDLNVDIEYQRSSFTDISDIGIPGIGNRPAPLPLSRFLGDPVAKNFQDRVLVGLDWIYRFSDDWKLRNRFQFNDVSYDQTTVFATDFDAVTGQLSRGLWRADMNRRTFATNLDLLGHLQTGPLGHDVLLGFDYYRFDGVSEAFGGPTPLVPAVNIYRPTYGVDLSTLTIRDRNQFSTFPEQWYGVYFQDQITLWEKLHILGGGRYDWAEVGTSFSETSLDKATESFIRTEYFSPRVGIVYQPWHWLSLYGNYVASLGSNNNGSPIPGSTLAPQTAQQWEAGLKTQLFDDRLTSTLAFYDLTKQSVITRIPGDLYDRTLGEANSRGVEFDVSGQITDNLSLIGSYAYTDARVTRDLAGTEGKRLVSVPRNAGSLWAKYTFNYGPLQGLTLGTGVFARSDCVADAENTAVVPGYVRWDASVGYSFKQLGSRITVQLNVYNLLDKDHYEHANTRLTIQPGQPLTFLGSLRLEY